MTNSELCRVFRFDPRANHSGHHALRRALNELILAGFLESKDGLVGPYRLSPQVETIQEALGISLVEAANLTRHEGMAVRPIFGGRPELTGAAAIVQRFIESYEQPPPKH